MSNLPDPVNIFTKTIEESLQTIEFTIAIVQEKLSKMKPNKAPGIDNFNSSMLREVSSAIASPLCEIFNGILEMGEVPLDWKKANVKPIYKNKGTKSQPCNYRPVSLTSHISKTLESIIRDEIIRHLQINELIKPSQHGFWKGRSCLTHTVTMYIDQGLPVDSIYLDFSKAFDRVPHVRLESKLKSHGIGGSVSDWITEWLTDRVQCVVVNGKTSEWSPVRSGVPQGSVLGSILFVIFINDLDEGVRNHILKFADDTKLFSQVSTYEWSNEWSMLFNAEKCKCIHYGYNNKQYDYFMGKKCIETTHEERDLGVIITETLDVTKQCVRAANKANAMLGMINRAFKYKTKEVVLKLYNSLVRPQLDYCIQVWRAHLNRKI